MGPNYFNSYPKPIGYQKPPYRTNVDYIYSIFGQIDRQLDRQLSQINSFIETYLDIFNKNAVLLENNLIDEAYQFNAYESVEFFLQKLDNRLNFVIKQREVDGFETAKQALIQLIEEFRQNTDALLDEALKNANIQMLDILPSVWQMPAKKYNNKQSYDIGKLLFFLNFIY